MNLTHHFLIAMPAMADPNFSGTLTYICEHSDRGALGVVVNRPLELQVGDLFSRIDLDLGDSQIARLPVFFGGPVQSDRGFVLHRPTGAWRSTLAVAEDVGLTTSRDILEAVSRGEGPADWLVTLGYAGWGAGQLEDEIGQNAWLTVGAAPGLLFGMAPEQRLSAAMALLGVDRHQLSDVAGHA